MDYERDRLAHLFWARVKKGEMCWEWQGTRTNLGYGRTPIGRRGPGPYAHRFSWELHYGPIPPGVLVCHKCDNPPCVRPDHLFLGTHKDNLRDMAAKGRQVFQRNPLKAARGERHGSRTHPESVRRGEDVSLAKLTAEKVREIRQRRAAGATIVALGRDYGVSHVAISAVCNRRTWRHVA